MWQSQVKKGTLLRKLNFEKNAIKVNPIKNDAISEICLTYDIQILPYNTGQELAAAGRVQSSANKAPLSAVFVLVSNGYRDVRICSMTCTTAAELIGWKSSKRSSTSSRLSSLSFGKVPMSPPQALAPPMPINHHLARGGAPRYLMV